jgi:tetratricopeptide (TPR) repeat protein
MIPRTLAVGLVLVVCAVAVGWSRPRLTQTMTKAKERSDVYVLPPPPVLARASLGYRAALADYLWAHVLVTQGLRMGAKRPFKEVEHYLDAINYLDPQFRDPYRLTDSLLSYQARDPDRAASVRRARQILERGLGTFPYDAELWLNYGQFLAYIGPGSLPKETGERDTWRNDGANALVRAGELGASDDSLAFRSLSAAAILNKAGEVDAAIRFLERLYAATENEAAREDILRSLVRLQAGKVASRDFDLAKRFDTLWRTEIPFAPRRMLSVLGPPVDSWSCAGPPAASSELLCDRTWTAWSEHNLRAESP